MLSTLGLDCRCLPGASRTPQTLPLSVLLLLPFVFCPCQCVPYHKKFPLPLPQPASHHFSNNPLPILLWSTKTESPLLGLQSLDQYPYFHALLLPCYGFPSRSCESRTCRSTPHLSDPHLMLRYHPSCWSPLWPPYHPSTVVLKAPPLPLLLPPPHKSSGPPAGCCIEFIQALH